MVKRPLDFLASRQGDRRDHLYNCAACGPPSLRPDASRMPDFECDTGRVGFSLDQVDVYTRCSSCGDKVSVECWERFADALAEPEPGEDDPHGIVAAIRARSWRAGASHILHAAMQPGAHAARAAATRTSHITDSPAHPRMASSSGLSARGMHQQDTPSPSVLHCLPQHLCTRLVSGCVVCGW